jgi:formate dehydrogenase subunit beta
MDKGFRLKKSAEQGLLDFLQYLLENKKIGSVFTLRKTSIHGTFDYGLITDVHMLKEAIPLHPYMPVNAAQELSRFTQVKEQIAVVIRPCELRAFVELVKRSQGKMDHFLFISYTCGGVLQIDATVNGNAKNLLSDYWKAVARGENFNGIRPTCRVCAHFVPISADVTVSTIGEKTGGECNLFLHTEKAKHLAEGFQGESFEGELDSETIDTLHTKRQEERKRLFDEIGSSRGLDGMVELFGKCIGCHGCSRVCPICHCVLCDFESHLFDYETSMIEEEVVRKGGVRLPPDTILYQIGRLNHMSFSCIGCGMCTEVCPVDIPVSAVFMRTGEETAKVFDYVPGRDVEEPVPVTVYKEEELSALGE